MVSKADSQVPNRAKLTGKQATKFADIPEDILHLHVKWNKINSTDCINNSLEVKFSVALVSIRISITVHP